MIASLTAWKFGLLGVAMVKGGDVDKEVGLGLGVQGRQNRGKVEC